jgi:hypothetical protein
LSSVKAVVAIIVASIVSIIGFALVLVFGAQIGGNASLYGSLSASNITKITTNVGNGVVTGSSFFSLIFLGAAAALVLGVISLVFVAVKGLGLGGGSD